MIRKAPSRIAIAPLPGTPKAMVGIRSPPSFELFAAPGPSTPRTSPVAEALRSLASFALCAAWAYAIHCATPPPAPGMMPTNTPTAEQRTTSQKCRKVSLMPSQTPALELRRRRVAGDRRAAHGEVDDLGDGEDADQHRDEVEPFPEVQQAEVEAQDARLALLADGGEQQAEQSHGEALELTPARPAR